MAYSSCISIALVVFLISIFPLHASAQVNGIVPSGSILTANETSSPWLSPSGDYAFGFLQLNDTEDQFLLAIWYQNIPDKTVVWYINTNATSVVSRGSTVQLGGVSGLSLLNPLGNTIWTTEGIDGQVFQGYMNDSGNFILQADDGRWLWYSFGYPADTILPTQELAPGAILNSRISSKKFYRGRYYLQFRDDGDIVLCSKNVRTIDSKDVVYYDSQTSGPTNSSNSVYHLLFNHQGSLYILDQSNQTFLNPPVFNQNASQYFLRATMDFDGVFTLYSHPKNFSGNPGWSIAWSVPNDICSSLTGNMGSGPCGYNNICKLSDGGKPVCKCPATYTLIDPEDEYGCCKSNSTVNCNEPTGAVGMFDFVELTDVDWPLNDFQHIENSTADKCKQECLDDCFCSVSVIHNDSCWKKRQPLSNGRYRANMSYHYTAFLKYTTADAPYLNTSSLPGWSNRNDKRTLILAGSVILGSSLFVNIILIVTLCSGLILIYRGRRWGAAKIRSSSALMEMNLRRFTSQEIAGATNGFKEELGRGSSGIVYKGEMNVSDGSVIVAVKKLGSLFVGNSDEEFRAEMKSIAQTNHQNLVRLLGFCDEGPHRCLVYEFMANGSLSSLIFSDQKPSWKLRTHIAVGIARGLTYLHEECTTRVIHCDIKPQNILLDEFYNARISDFGLAKLMPVGKSMTLLTHVRGTKGYVAPEWFRISHPHISSKVDVYSFGVLLLEIISCRRSVDQSEVDGENCHLLMDIAWDCLQQKRLNILVQDDPEALQDLMVLERFVMVGIWCIQENAGARPTMKKVSQMLEGVIQVMEPPPPYALLSSTS